MLFCIHSEMIFVIPVVGARPTNEQNSDFKEPDMRLTNTV